MNPDAAAGGALAGVPQVGQNVPVMLVPQLAQKGMLNSYRWFDGQASLPAPSCHSNLIKPWCHRGRLTKPGQYRAFARKAELDGLPKIARLFRAASAAECVHAEVATTADNLNAAIEGDVRIRVHPVRQAKSG